MENILVVLNIDHSGEISKVAREVITVARTVADIFQTSFAVGIISKEPLSVAKKIGGCGASCFLGISEDIFLIPRYCTDAYALEVFCRKISPTIVIASGTSRWNRVLPGVAHRLNGRADLHITKIVNENKQISVIRWFYRQRMEATLTRSTRPWFIGIEPGSFSPWELVPQDDVSVEILTPNVESLQIRTEMVGYQSPPEEHQTIRPDAELLFVAGAGWTKKQADGKVHTDKAAELILEFLRLTKASLGGSKSLVDLSAEGQSVLPFMTHLNQVGQTGATPRHPKGLATCCHGEEPHVVGWRFITERRAVNLDPNCGWAHGKADVVYIADAFAVIERLNELLKNLS